MTNLPDRWLEISLKDGSTFKAELGCLEQVEEAYRTYNEQRPEYGCFNYQDKVLQIPLICGTDLTLTVSGITYFLVTGRETAEKVWEHNKEIRQLHKAVDPEFD